MKHDKPGTLSMVSYLIFDEANKQCVTCDAGKMTKVALLKFMNR
jgi:hypothetical protein